LGEEKPREMLDVGGREKFHERWRETTKVRMKGTMG
jgi:hypothetical protein